jgi:hypothetical protein
MIMNHQQTRFLEWYAKMYGVYQAMPESERAKLFAWEQENVTGDGRVGTSDWPGWEKYIGLQPAPTPNIDKVLDGAGTVYLIKAESGEYKIGYTVDLISRLRTFSTAMPRPLTLVHFIQTNDMAALERSLHVRFAGKRVRGEWFELDEDDVNWIKSLDHQQNIVRHL